MARAIDGGTFAIVSSGVAEGPAQALRDYLLRQGADFVQTVFHPLEAGTTHHEIVAYERGAAGRIHGSRRRISLPSRPPFTYPLDLLVPLSIPAVDGWFGFNGLATARGLAARAMGRVDTVVHWCVDFVPERFGRGFVTQVYDTVDRACCQRANARVELSTAARDGRNARHGFSHGEAAPVEIIPMGAWLDRTPTTSSSDPEWRVVYLGHLVPRQGVRHLIDAVAAITERGHPIHADIVGRGPSQAELEAQAAKLGVADVVRFHGFVEDHREVEEILAGGSAAIAPYETDPESFTQYADPGKLKAYLGCGLPIITTPVPPNADELQRRGAAQLVDAGGEPIAEAIIDLLSSPERWRAARGASLDLAREFDWPKLLTGPLERIGFRS